MKYTNRYGDVYTFTKQEDGNVLWEGSFKWCRYGWPNVYKDAYQQYRKDGGDMHIQDFEKEVHRYDDVTFEYSEISKKYQSLVYSDTKNISMVDPSGGPYVTAGMDMKYFGEELKGLIVRSFTPAEEGYIVNVYNEFDHLADTEIIGGIINTSK